MAKTVAQWREEVHNLEKANVRLETSLSMNQESMARLEKRCSDQHEQILRLQDALVAREAPDAYADRKVDEAEPELTDAQIEAAKKDRELARVNRQMLDRITDDHYFSSPDDMIEQLTQGVVPEFERTHQNDES